MNWKRANICALSLLSLSACATIDHSIADRVQTFNMTSAEARNNGIPLNIIRAAYSEPLNVVAISKISGQQTSTIQLGFPTITFGPSQTIGQHQYIFGGNTWSNSVQTSFDTAPTDTSDFAQGLMSTVDPQTVAAFIREGVPRELVLDLFIDSIRMNKQDHSSIVVSNDPSLNDPARCPTMADKELSGDKALLDRYGPRILLGSSREASTCRYRFFQGALAAAMQWGISVQTREIPNPAYSAGAPSSSSGSSSPKKIVESRFCFDPAYANADSHLTQGVNAKFLCNSGWLASDSGTSPLVVKFGGSAPVEITIQLRSTYGVFHFVGKLMRYGTSTMPRLRDPDAIYQMGSNMLFPTQEGLLQTGGPCFAKATYMNQSYCIPERAQIYAKQAIGVLSQLVSLDVTTGSLPTTLDVHVQ